MAKKMRVQQSIALALALFLCAPVVAFAADGKKHFKEGLKYEENRQWDKAATQFALAVAEKPSNVEYQLHLQRALVSAGLMLVERGDSLAEKKDYNAAYTAYREAYAYDPGNELALIKMRRMLEAQGLPVTDLPKSGDPAGPKLKPQGNDPNVKAYFSGSAAGLPASPVRIQLPSIPGRKFGRTDVIYRDTNLLTAIEQLAQMMKLNVMPDQSIAAQLRTMKTTVELRDVTYPRALEMLLRTNNLMYAQIDSRTIAIASDNPQSRLKYEPYAVRTFYVKNADISELKGALSAALPQTKSVTPIKQLNALLVRDTPSNLELVEQMINSLDKSKAEVLIDINIYEVSRTNLLQLGNQFATTASTTSSGALVPGLNQLGGYGSASYAPGAIQAAAVAAGKLFAIGLPTSAISAFQDKGKAKLLASTQVHVIDGEAHAIRIGQRVPIRTATLPTFGTAPPTTGTTPPPNGGGAISGFGIEQIQYESIGLNIDMTPVVFEDDVQMKMKIETSNIDGSTSSLTPTFNQRTMSSIARVKDGQTTMIAGVSQNVEAKNIKGLPLIGLIPILGRFFATPENKETQSDVVITVTPHILRRADITDNDHLAHWAGDAQSSNNQLKLEQILYLADLQDSQESPVAAAGGEAAQPVAGEIKPAVLPGSVSPRSETPGVVVQPLPTTQVSKAPAAPRPNIVKTTVDKPGGQSLQSSQNGKNLDDDDDDDDDDSSENQAATPLVVYVRPTTAVATKGQDLYVAIFVNGNGEISSTHVAMNYDPNLLEVKGVRDSGMLSAGARADLQFTAEGGVINIQMDRAQGVGAVPARGQLCLIVFGVKAPGQSPLLLNESATYFRTPSGQTLPLKVQSSQVEIR